MTAVLAAAFLPLALAVSDERSFFHLPGEGDFRFQTVAKADNEKDWPFAAAEGYLACVWVMGQRQVYFIDRKGAAANDARPLSISSDPFQLALVNMGQAHLFAPFGGLEDLVRRVSPFVQVGQKLCDQPRGTEIGPGEL